MISLLAIPIATLLFVVPTMAGSTVAVTPEILATSTQLEIIATTTPEVVKFNEPATYDSEIRRLAVKYGFDETLARKIIKCESLAYGGSAENKNYRMEWDENLGTSTMTHWSTDYSYWQVNDYWHAETARKMGYDIRDWKDNLEYGAILLSRDGVRHWSASKYCWSSI